MENQEHTITVTEVRKHQADVTDPERLLGEKTLVDLAGVERTHGLGLAPVETLRSTFDCSCGERFLKRKTAAKHLEEANSND